ncbi:MAG TPA: efflux RND transporter permease subunit [Polyangiaceae bacterium]|nr:efflux RND transporter permease subunit [Polyangiaceae bacterium]
MSAKPSVPPSAGAPAPAVTPEASLGIAGLLARAFVGSKLTPLFIVTSVLLGLLAIVLLPREEEPQIKVPMVDVMLTMEGGTAEEVESRVSAPMERLLWEIPGVEYVYTTSQPGRSMAVVRFRVGEDVERSLVKLNQKLQSNHDRIPTGVSPPLVKLRSIDDVPILALTFHSKTHDHLALRRVVAEVDANVKRVPEVSETTIIGGLRRAVRVKLDPARLSAHSLAIGDVAPMLQQANRQIAAGSLVTGDRDVLVETGGFFTDATEVGGAVVGVYQGRPVALRDVATIEDTAEELSQYVFAATAGTPGEEPAVTLAVAKRPNTNAISVAKAVLAEVEALKGTRIPADITVSVTRHYGMTAAEKSDELLMHMGIAIVSVSLLILFMLGWRESVVVAVAIPSTLALTLTVFQLVGYTLNRITLFALIFSIGILVDDAIVVVENVVRHRDLPENRGLGMAQVAVKAVAEVGNPTVLATLAVIAAILPMAFVGGLMGPYMRPIPVGASAAMGFSLIVAFVVTPWAAARVLRAKPGGHGHDHGDAAPRDRMTRAYTWVMHRLVTRTAWRWSFLVGIAALLVGALAFVPAGAVKVKMLPFDNKSEFQIILNMPEGSSLERTAQAARELGDAVRGEPEVTDYQVYVGAASPFNFNGLVRHYYLRRGPSVADIQVNLLPKDERAAQSHAVARRVRPAVKAVADRYGARVAIAEVPPGPPVLQTLVAEVYGPSAAHRRALAERVREIYKKTPGVVDVDWYVEEPHAKDRLVIDKEKAALHGISAEAIAATVRVAVGGAPVGLLHLPREVEDVEIRLELPRASRASTEELLALGVRGSSGGLVALRELTRVERTVEDASIYHKNLMPVVYVTADVAGGAESSAYAILDMNKDLARLDAGDFGGKHGPVATYNLAQPTSTLEPAIKWDGEWHITLEVFRDLGMAFGVVLVLIYVLLVGWFRSFLVPLVVMAAIPFSLVGILPAHAAMGAFFTATSMIGFMAGAGIVVRNSIILVDFTESRVAEGVPLAEAVVLAGAVRFRPMLLTALAVVVGAAVILFDPIFQGLALSLMAGEIASLLISRMAVPVLYEMAKRRTTPAPSVDVEPAEPGDGASPSTPSEPLAEGALA